MNVRELRPEQGYKRKVANALDLYRRGYLTKEQVVRLCKQYKLDAERS
jgi:antitoxin component HigA of HigAB toxin-antitoxin module